MYASRDGTMFLTISQRCYDELWESVNGKKNDHVGFQHLQIGDVVMVVDSPSFWEWVQEKPKKREL